MEENVLGGDSVDMFANEGISEEDIDFGEFASDADDFDNIDVDESECGDDGENILDELELSEDDISFDLGDDEDTDINDIDFDEL